MVERPSRRYLAKRDYAGVARRTVKEMHRQVGDLGFDECGLARRGLLVRHLVMPGLAHESEAILRWIADELGSDTYVDVMAQYYPAGRTDEFPEIDRRLYRPEFEHALAVADGLGLRRLDRRSRPRPCGWPTRWSDGQRADTGFVAANVWRRIDRELLAARHPLTYSFVPNVIWMPADVAKLTDREGSFAQQFVHALP